MKLSEQRKSNQKEPLLGSMSINQKESVLENKNNISQSIDVSMLHAGEKSIDFKKLLNKYRSRTEAELPYTIQQVEDVIFVNRELVIALEYIFYQIDGNYVRIKKDKIVDHDTIQNYQSRPLGTFKYLKNLKDNFPHSIYQDEPIDLVENKKDWFEEHKQQFVNHTAKKQSVSGINLQGLMQQNMQQQINDHGQVKFMKTNDGNALVEAVLSLWEINHKGQIMKKQETSFDYDMNFKPSTGTQMRLQLSEDKKNISLPMVDKNNKVRFLAWKTKNLQKIEISSALTKATQDLPQGTLKSMNFVGKSNYIFQIIKQSQNLPERTNKATRQKYIPKKLSYLYLIFDAKTGQKLLEWSNIYENKKNLRVLGFLVNEKVSEKKNQEMRDQGEESEYGDEADADDSEDAKSDYDEEFTESEEEDDKSTTQKEGETQKSEGDENYSGGEEEIDITKIDLDLVFFYIYEPSQPNEKVDAQDHTQNWVWLKKNMKLRDIITAQENGSSVLQYIEDQGQEAYKDDYSGKHFFNIPKDWFVKSKEGKEALVGGGKTKKKRVDHVNWEAQILLASNKKFKMFSMLNERQNNKVFMAFDSTQQSKNAMVTMFLPKLSINKIVRNQMCKDYPILIQSIPGKGSTAHVFYAKDQKKSINFQESQIFLNALQDVQHQQLLDKDFKQPWKSSMLQSLTISKGDQEISMKTEVKNMSKEDDAQDIIIAERVTQSQKHSGVYPCFLYNIGQNKLILQNTLPNGKQYILRLGQNETFIDHIQYNKLSDIAFYPNGINIEASSRFAFLTFDKKKKKIINNFLICDPYYDDIQIALFQSTKQFSSKEFFNIKDVMVRNIMYHNQDHDLRIVTQNPGKINVHKLKDADELEHDEDDDYDDNSDVSSQKKKEQSDNEEKEEEEIPEFSYASAPMIQDDQGVIYYITKYEGQCTIMEINPRDDANIQYLPPGENIFEIKSDLCLGFSFNQGNFYFMDGFKTINQLKRIKGQRLLQESKQIHMKDKDIPNFQKKDFYEELYCNENYILQQSKIFYLQDNFLLADGVLDMEQLSQQQSKDLKVNNSEKKSYIYASGPFIYRGSSEFVNVYQQSDSYIYRQKIYSLPDNKTNVLINDIDNKVDMSTFLYDGKILVKIAQRFMLFDKNGAFIDQVDFEDLRAERQKEEENQKLQKYYAKINEKMEQGMKNQGKKVNWGLIEKKSIEIQIKKNDLVAFQKRNASDRMKLHRMSQDNKYFLFEDKHLQKYKLYQLKSTPQQIADKTIIFSGKSAKSKTKDKHDQWEFVVEYEIDFKKTKLMENLDLSWEIPEQIEAFYKKMDSREVRKEITKDGDVIIVSNHIPDIMQEYKIKIVGCIIHQRDGIIKNLKQTLNFDENAKDDVVKTLDQMISKNENRKEIAKAELDLLPKNLKDDKKVKEIEQKIQDLEDRKNNIYTAAVFDDDLLIVQCGRYIKYVQLNDSMFNDDENSVNEFYDLKVNFDKEYEIIKILDTCTPYHLQIIARNREKKVLIVFVWDFEKNIEVSMFQLDIYPDFKPENYICKGMNQKRNYFVNSHQIYDLEYNIPFQSSNNNSMKGKGVGTLYVDQRKIFEDGTRSLSIDHPSLLNFPNSRMDIIFWDNIVTEGEDVEIIKHNITLKTLNVVYEDNSLFHYFADNVEVIEMIHDKFMTAKEEGHLKDSEKNTPLTLLYPDPEGKTALDIALEKNRPKSFELMIDMLEGYTEYMLSKLMLSVVPFMINNANETIQRFYKGAVYKPTLMQQPFIITWPDELDDFVFCSKTSIMSQQFLIEELLKSGKLQEEDISFLINKTPKNDNATSAFKEKFEKKTKKEQIRQRRRKLMPQELKIDEDDDNVHSHMKRVQCEAIDFDWIFQGNNMENMIKILNDQDNAKLYVQKTIKVFIDLIWERYSKEIQKKIFYPYIVYLFSFMLLSTSCDDGYLVQIEKSQGTQSDFIWFLIKLNLCIFLWVYQCRREYKQIMTNFTDYIKQGWNVVDLLSLSLNLWIFIQMIVNAIQEHNVFSVGDMRAYIACACFVMWIKVFYWMRLYKDFAYYVKLITQTLKDVKLFLLLCLIIIFAFANFFFMLNIGTDDNDRALIHYTGFKILDSIIAIYQFSLGDFHYSGFIHSEYDFLLWISFMVCTFLMIVVFMNMIIAIMGNTFGNVMNLQYENSLNENVGLIYDHIWLLDLKEEFQDFKYIIRVTPDISVSNDAVDLSDQIQELELKLVQKQDNTNKLLSKRIEQFEKNVRALLKNQQSKSVSLKKMMIQLLEDSQKTREEERKPIQNTNRGIDVSQIEDIEVQNQEQDGMDFSQKLPAKDSEVRSFRKFSYFENQ